MKQIVFRKKKLVLDYARYKNDRLCITLLEAKSGDEWYVATVNLPDVELGQDEVIIKDYSENEGIFKALVDAGVIVDTGKRVKSGYVSCPVGLIKQHSIPIGIGGAYISRDRDTVNLAIKVPLKKDLVV